MKILYIHQYFKTPEEGGAIRSYHFAKALINAGFEVEILTTHSNKNYKKILLEEKMIIHYLPIDYNNSMHKWQRIRSFIQFYRECLKIVKQIKNIDLCFATSTPLTVAYLGMKIHQKLKIPFYVELRDLWPEAPIALGFIKNRFVKKMLFYYEKKIYKKAKKIIVLSPKSKEIIEKKALNKEVILIPNMSDTSFFKASSPSNEIIEKYNLTDKFGVAYTGTIGKANHLEYLLDIAELCQKEKLTQVQFLIIGKGSELNRLKKAYEIKSLNNIIFIPFADKSEIKKILDACQATYTSFLKVPILESTSPNKFFDSLANGKLTIVNTEGWLKDLVESAHCGFYADPKKPSDFIKKIKIFLEDENLLNQYQTNAFSLAKKRFDRKILCKSFVNIFLTKK